MKIQQIGICIGCKARGRIDDGVCHACVGRFSIRNNKKWATMASRIRADNGFALAIYSMIQTPGGKKMFVEAFGLPEGAESLPQVKLGLRLVN
jgi:hypothetical protein